VTVEATLSTRLGAMVTDCRPLSGGEISRVFRIDLDDGRRLVVKEASNAAAEGEMLSAIRSTGCVAPEIVFAEGNLLVMEWLADGGTPTVSGWAAAGRAVAVLHGSMGDAYGWQANHAFGPVVIPNAPATDWPTFWAERRLLAAPDALPGDLRDRVERLASKLPELLPARPPPSLLHGDLWSGNLVFSPDGFSGLIDPAACYGDAEVDLAMLTLFGSPSRAFFDAYGPLRDGVEKRRPIYQLWPALVHLRLFGAGYRGIVDRLIDEIGV
jgi:fructosamine-3-kinase